MPRLTAAVWGTLAVAVIMGCGDDESSSSKPGKDAGSDATDASVDTTTDTFEASTPSPVGDPCTTTPPDFQGTCPSDFVCFNSPGGYCTQVCSFQACPADALCIPSPKQGELCAKKCESDADCREAEGYSCDPDWKACTQWPVSPKLAQCPSTPALPRTTFGEVTQLSTAAGPGKYHMEPAAAFDAQGALSAVYMARNDVFETNALGVSTLSTSGTLNGDRPLASTSTNAFDTWIARDKTGKLHLVYFGHDGFDVNSKIWYTTSTDGISWSAEKNVLQPGDCPGNGTGCTDKPMIAIGPAPGDPTNEIVYVLYYSPTGERLIRSLDGGSTFESSVPVPGAAYGDVEVASDGSVHSVTATPGPNQLGDVMGAISYTRSTDGGQTFVPAVTVEEASEPTPFYFSNPQVVFNPATNSTFVVYPTGTPDGVWNIRLATSLDAGQSWTRITVNDDAPCANHATPTILLDPASGSLHVAWIENRGGVGRVAYTVCNADGSQCAANQAISDQPFASYELVRHSPRWMGEYFALLLDPTGTKIHAVWTQPVAESGGPRSRIFHSSGNL